MIPDYTPPAVIGSLPREGEPTPKQIEEAIAYVRGMCEPATWPGILLFAFDRMTAERDGFFRRVAQLERENAAQRAALGLHNLEVEPAPSPAAHLPAHIASALRLVGDYCASEGYGSCVVQPHGGAAFERHDVLRELIAARRGAPGSEEAPTPYEALREAIIAAFDPADDDSAEEAILEEAVRAAGVELRRLRAENAAQRQALTGVNLEVGQ